MEPGSEDRKTAKLKIRECLVSIIRCSLKLDATFILSRIRRLLHRSFPLVPACDTLDFHVKRHQFVKAGVKPHDIDDVETVRPRENKLGGKHDTE